MIQKITDKILNHLKYGKTANGRVGCRVEAIEDKANKAWISISTKKNYDVRKDPTQETIICYEIEYVELDKSYSEEKGMDFDLFLVKKEMFYNLKDVSKLEETLRRWVRDFSIIEPIANVSHPMF